MELDLSILNQKGSPAIYQDIFANRPTAGFTGRLFVSTDTDELYRDNGTGWDLIGGGGGGSVNVDGISIRGAGTLANPYFTGLDNVLEKAQALTANRSFKFNNQNVDFTDNKKTRFITKTGAVNVFEIDDANNVLQLGYTQFKASFGTSNFTLFNSLKGLIFDSNYFQLYDLNISNWYGFQIDPLGSAKLGFDFNAHIGTGTKLVQTFFDTTNIEKGIRLDANFDIYQFGDWDSAGTGGNQSNIELDKGGASCEIYVYNSTTNASTYWRQLENAIDFQYNGSPNGILIDLFNKIYKFGDFNVVSQDYCNIFLDSTARKITLESFENSSGRSLFIDNNAATAELKLYSNVNGDGVRLNYVTQIYEFGCYQNDSYIKIENTSNKVTIATDLFTLSGALVVGSASGSSGDHLQVTINGTPYVIALLNP